MRGQRNDASSRGEVVLLIGGIESAADQNGKTNPHPRASSMVGDGRLWPDWPENSIEFLHIGGDVMCAAKIEHLLGLGDTAIGEPERQGGRLVAARSPGLRLALALEIERHCSADEILQGRLIDLVAFVDVDGAPDIPVEAGVE